MAPSAIYETVAQEPLGQKQLLKVKNAPTTYRNDTLKGPVADDYMYAFKYNFPLPTHDGSDGSNVLDFTEEDETDRRAISEQFLKQLEQVIQSRDSKAFAELFLYSGEFNEAPDNNPCREP
jgi:hypothetical protein